MAHARKDYYAVLTQPVPVRTKARVCDAVAFGWCPDALSFEAGTTIRFQLGVASPPLAEGDVVKLRVQLLQSTKVR